MRIIRLAGNKVRMKMILNKKTGQLTAVVIDENGNPAPHNPNHDGIERLIPTSDPTVIYHEESNEPLPLEQPPAIAEEEGEQNRLLL